MPYRCYRTRPLRLLEDEEEHKQRRGVSSQRSGPGAAYLRVEGGGRRLLHQRGERLHRGGRGGRGGKRGGGRLKSDREVGRREKRRTEEVKEGGREREGGGGRLRGKDSEREREGGGGRVMGERDGGCMR